MEASVLILACSLTACRKFAFMACSWAFALAAFSAVLLKWSPAFFNLLRRAGCKLDLICLYFPFPPYQPPLLP
eukprot:9459843-Prorocentrum_lima.AAC.1